jgi:hypothetical protein
MSFAHPSCIVLEIIKEVSPPDSMWADTHVLYNMYITAHKYDLYE